MNTLRHALMFTILFSVAATCRAGVGDPQVRTNHPWYPGELACSTFERLFATQAAVYERVTGTKPVSDEDRALAKKMSFGQARKSWGRNGCRQTSIIQLLRSGVFG